MKAMTKPATPEQQAASFVGRTGLYLLQSRWPDRQIGTAEIAFPVKVVDAKPAFGKVLLHIEPVDGEGDWWVASHKVRFAE